MTGILQTVGQVAGLGGLALGVFLLLFRRIKLPTGSRRHLTLFMWLVWSIAALGLICYAASILSAHRTTQLKGDRHVPIFREPYFFITYPDNFPFISFLEAHDGKIVFLNTHLDASVSLEEQWQIVERENIDLDLITSCKFGGVPLPLPNEEGKIVTVTFYFSDNHVLNYSAGGTGVITVGINGFYEVSRTFHGGPTTSFHLKEVEAPFDARRKILNE